MPHLTLVLGGARSGKSRHAESLLIAGPHPAVYVATAQPLDDEMRARIAAHRQARAGTGWETVEEPVALGRALRNAKDRPVLVDCLTLWVTNLLIGEHDVEAAVRDLLAALDQREARSVLVSNEVGLGIVPENGLARRFRDEAGRLHQELASRADTVLFMVAGIPMKVK